MIKPEQTRRRFLQTIGTGTAASLMGAGVSCGQSQPSAGKKQRRLEKRGGLSWVWLHIRSENSNSKRRWR